MDEEKPRLYTTKGRMLCYEDVWADINGKKEKVAEIEKSSRFGMKDYANHPFWYSATIIKVYNAPPHEVLYKVMGCGEYEKVLNYLNESAFFKNGEWWYGSYDNERYRPPKEQYSFKCTCGYDYFTYFGDCMVCECCGKSYRLTEDISVPVIFLGHSA